MQKLDFPVFQIPFERNTKTKCQNCNQSFGVTRREHICKRCYRSVCDDCSPYKVRSYRADLNHRLHRMCTRCHIESQILNRYIENNKLRWGQDSDMSKLWLKQFGYKVPPKVRSSLKFKKQFSISIEQLWKSLNFSFREFVGIAIDKSKIQNSQIIQTINICLSQVCHSSSAQPEKAIYLLMFFLAHSSPENAIVFTKSVLQLLSLQKPSIQNIQNYLSLMNCTDIQSYKMQSFLQQKLSSLIQTATVNYFTAQINIQIISSLISKKSYREIEKGIAFVLNQNKNFICKNSMQIGCILLNVLRNSSSSGYRKIIKDLQVSVYNYDLSQTTNNKTQSNSTVVTDKKYQKLIKQNEELKIMNKNQQDQILRLKVENKNYIQKEKAQKQAKKIQEQKDIWFQMKKKQNTQNSNLKTLKEFDEFSEIKVQLENQSMQSYYQYEQDQNFNQPKQKNKKVMRMIRDNFNGFKQQKNFNIVLQQLIQKIGKKSSGIVKKYRPKKTRRPTNFAMNNRIQAKKTNHQRMSTCSQKMINLSNQRKQKVKKEQKYQNSYQQIMICKNQQIAKLRKQLNNSKFTIKEGELEMSEMKESLLKNNEQKQVRIKQIEILKKEKLKTEQNLKSMQQMNKKLLLKMKQLSNLLMDKQQQMVQDSTKSLQQLAKQYENQIKKGQGCSVF